MLTRPDAGVLVEGEVGAQLLFGQKWIPRKKYQLLTGRRGWLNRCGGYMDHWRGRRIIVPLPR